MKAVVSGDQGQADQAKGRAAEAMTKAQNIPVEQARAQVDQDERQYRQMVADTKAKAAQAADATASAISRGALLGL